MSLSLKAREEVEWWNSTIATADSPIRRENPHIIIKTDASLRAWGAVCNQVRTGGAWLVEETDNMHINELEMMATFMGLKSFAKDRTDIHVQIYTDNVSTMACINKMGSSKLPKLDHLSRTTWDWCKERNIWLSMARIVGCENIEADHESRHVNIDTEWKLNTILLQEALGLLNFTPEIDLFASRLNHQFHDYISFKPDPGAIGIDAFAVSWGDKNLYAFPPFCLLTRVLQKIKAEAATGVVVAPYWPAQPFFPVLMKLLVDHPILLSARKKPSTPSQSSRDPPSPSQETKIPCMQGVGDRLRQQGFSAKATEVMLDSWRPDTKKVYASYITKWQRYAAAIKVDSVSTPITGTVNFLADLYEKGASHSALCIARSALSSYVDIQDF
ncbi:reverse transcriptase/ribonuclease h/methyltransferase, partial [Plakobranchus ocellatus]